MAEKKKTKNFNRIIIHELFIRNMLEGNIMGKKGWEGPSEVMWSWLWVVKVVTKWRELQQIEKTDYSDKAYPLEDDDEWHVSNKTRVAWIRKLIQRNQSTLWTQFKWPLLEKEKPPKDQYKKRKNSDPTQQASGPLRKKEYIVTPLYSSLFRVTSRERITGPCRTAVQLARSQATS